MSDCYEPHRAYVTPALAARVQAALGSVPIVDVKPVYPLPLLDPPPAPLRVKGLDCPVLVDGRMPADRIALADRSYLQRALDEYINGELRKPNPRAVCIITGV